LLFKIRLILAKMHKKNLDGNSSMAIFFVHRAKVFYNNIFLQMLTMFSFFFCIIGMMLSVFVGSGVQVFIMTLITLIFACLGFLSPANRGALMTCALVLFVCLGTPAGYVSSRIYKSFGGERWKLNVLLTSMFCPG